VRHVLFILLHLGALLFLPIALWLTLPLHILAGVFGGRSAPAVDRITARTHRQCPDCREPVLRDASKCKHCGTRLIPGQ
jgi:hypothetical protein